MVCPTGHKFRANAKDLFCMSTGHVIDSEVTPCQSSNAADVSQCCQHAASCSTLECPADTYADKHSKHLLYCHSSPCDNNTDLGLCCDERVSCDGLVCGLGLTDKADKASILCHGSVCSGIYDGAHCCDSAPSCGNLSCSHRKGYVNKKQSLLYCAGKTCNITVDVGTCCEKAATCSNVDCESSPGLTALPDSSKVYCSGPVCNPTIDNVTCCVQKASCSSLQGNCSSHGLVDRNGSAKLYCAGNECIDDDKDTCCVGKQSCASYRCPTGYVGRNAENLTCAGAECGDQDKITCCEAAASCTAFKCTGRYVDQWNKAFKFCAGPACNNGTDAALCCDWAEDCNQLSCASQNAGYINKVEPLPLCRSPGSKCTAADFGVCCEPIPTPAPGSACQGSLLSCPASVADPCQLQTVPGACYSSFHDCDGSGEYKQCGIVNGACTGLNICSVSCSDATVEDPDFAIRSCPSLGFHVAVAVVGNFVVVTANANGETWTEVISLEDEVVTVR